MDLLTHTIHHDLQACQEHAAAQAVWHVDVERSDVMKQSQFADAVRYLARLVFFLMPMELSANDTLSRQPWSITCYRPVLLSDTLSILARETLLVCVWLMAHQPMAFRVLKF